MNAIETITLVAFASAFISSVAGYVLIGLDEKGRVDHVLGGIGYLCIPVTAIAVSAPLAVCAIATIVKAIEVLF